MMEVVVVLSHLMSKEGHLGDETVSRVETAVELCNRRNCRLLITSGWAYRDDSSLAMGDVVAAYIKRNFELTNCTVLSDTNSRDTVGDAFFLRRKLINVNYSKLAVVTSDYHLNRTKIIFEAFFGSSVPIEVIGTSTNVCKDSDILKHEYDSIEAFQKTFIEVDFEKEDQVIDVMSNDHPFYNGTIYPKISVV